MIRTVKIFMLCLAFCLLSAGGVAEAVIVTITGDWNLEIEPDPAIDSYQSAADQLEMSITRPGGGGNPRNWQVDVSRDDGEWHEDFVLELRRTSDGVGPGGMAGVVVGGLDYMEVTGDDTLFIEGDGRLSEIHIQLRLSADSFVAIPLGTYDTTIIFTATN